MWRVVGLIESSVERGSAQDKRRCSQTELKAVEEYAAECSMIKVYASEMLDYVVDEGVQIHGGYGYHQDYRWNGLTAIPESTVSSKAPTKSTGCSYTGMLLKRAARGQLALAPGCSGGRRAGKSTQGIREFHGRSDEDARLVQSAKKIALFTIGIAYQKYGAELEKQQEIVMSISDIIMEVLAMESSLLRSRKLAASGKGRMLRTCAPFSCVRRWIE